MGVPTWFFMGANRTKKTQQTPFTQPAWFACCGRPCLGSLAVLGLDGSASSCSLERGAWSPTKSAKRSTLLFAKTSVLIQCANTFQNASLYNSQRLAQCNVRVRTRQLGLAQTPTLLTVLLAALCSAKRCAMLRAVQRWEGCTMLRNVQLCAQCSAGRSEALGAL